MSAVCVVQPRANAAGGSDVTPSNTFAWGDIVVTNTSGVENNSATAQILAGIDAPIVVRAAWTSTSSSPALGQWIKNGVAVQAPQATPVEVTANVGDTLYWQTYCADTHPAGNYDNGTVTVTNQTDGAAVLDTFTFVCQYTYTGGGSGGGAGGGGGVEPPLKETP